MLIPGALSGLLNVSYTWIHAAGPDSDIVKGSNRETLYYLMTRITGQDHLSPAFAPDFPQVSHWPRYVERWAGGG